MYVKLLIIKHNQQETQIFIFVGSSETIRDTPLRWKYSPIFYESINTIKPYFTLIMKGKLSKMSKSSFKCCLSNFSANNDPDKFLAHYLAGLAFFLINIFIKKNVKVTVL